MKTGKFSATQHDVGSWAGLLTLLWSMEEWTRGMKALMEWKDNQGKGGRKEVWVVHRQKQTLFEIINFKFCYLFL